MADAQEFADPPPAVQSQSASTVYFGSAGGNGQPLTFAAANSTPDAPFLTQLGG
ncbi:MAG: hypothetical protein JO156_14670 [Solirubrobacterales bacterium]|nr:hypothetical protein [Solirubrobacterales bacterium]